MTTIIYKEKVDIYTKIKIIEIK